MTNEEILQWAHGKYGLLAQSDMCIEEMAELTQAILKWRRHWGDVAVFNNLIEEIVDVEIMITQMKMMYGEPNQYETVYQQKIDKLKERLES